MEPLVRVAIQLEEAKRLAELHGDEYDRLALILADNVAELLLYRHAWIKIREEEQRREQVRWLVGRNDISDTLAELRDRTLSNLMSRTKAKRIEREFNPKVELAEADGFITSAEGATIRKLHAYRNEAQHRDSIRRETLRTSLAIYLWLASELFVEIPIRSVAVPSPGSGWPDVFRRVIGEAVDREADPFALPRLFTDAFRTDLAIDSATMSEALGANLLSRVDYIREGVEYLAANSLGFDNSSPEDAFHRVQIEENLGADWLDPAVVAATPVNYEFDVLDLWSTRAANLQEGMEVVDAFAEFSNIEDELEKVEGRVYEAVVHLDIAINLEVDRQLGK